MSYSPVYQPGEEVGFYGNFKVPLSESTAGWQLDIISPNIDLKAQNVGVLKYNFLDDTHFHFHSTFIMPQLSVGCYHFMIRVNGTNEVKFVSENTFQVVTAFELKKTLPVKYRSKGDISNFYYSNIPEFFNQCRLHLILMKPQPSEAAKGFETSKGEFYRTISILKETVSFIAKWFDREAHRAMLSMCTHSTLIIDGEKYRKGDSGSYEPNWPEIKDTITDAEITLEVVDYAEANNDC